jgi:hypothetical protein
LRFYLQSEVQVFIHDVNREAEKAIIQNYFGGNYYEDVTTRSLGALSGRYGTLAGFTLAKAKV